MDKRFVKVIYDMYVDGENGQEELMERATEEMPLTYIEGIGMMLPAFEQAMADKQVGDSFDFRIPCEKAYGEYDTEEVITLEKDRFEIDGKFDEERVFEGNIIPMTTIDGGIAHAQVVSVDDKGVTLDLNHPLAGENLHFIGSVIEVREATAEEIAQMTQGCHCGCDRSNCGDCEGQCGEK